MEREARVEQLFLSTQAMIRSWKGYFVRALAPEHISPVQMGLLMYLKSRGTASGRNIGADMQLSPSAVTQLLDSLGDCGYIRREASSTDKRVTYISLTTEGLNKLTDMENRNKQFFKKVTDGLSDHEIETMISTQQKIIDQVHEHARQTGAKNE